MFTLIPTPLYLCPFYRFLIPGSLPWFHHLEKIIKGSEFLGQPFQVLPPVFLIMYV
jgi:hypothetical protein